MLLAFLLRFLNASPALSRLQLSRAAAIWARSRAGPGGAPRAPAEACVCGTPRVPAMSDMTKDGGIRAVQAAVAASTDKAEMHKCTEYRGRFGQGLRQRVPVHMLVPHPDNRSGVFPSSTRVRELACQIIVLGFSQAEADFEGVCVRDYTADQLK